MTRGVDAVDSACLRPPALINSRTMANLISAAALGAVLLLVGACQSSPEDESAENGGNSLPIEERQESPPELQTNDAADPDRAEPEGSMTGTIPGTVIPQPFRGRWGMVAADCGPHKANAKGLLTIGSEILRFYESVGEPVTLERTAPDRVEGSFAFSGEGMEWTKRMTLTLGSNNETLVRTETDPDGSYTYTRCPG